MVDEQAIYATKAKITLHEAAITRDLSPALPVIMCKLTFTAACLIITKDTHICVAGGTPYWVNKPICVEGSLCMFSSKADYDAFIGSEFIAKYPRLYPFLCFVAYRVMESEEAPQPVVRGYECNPAGSLLKRSIKYVLYTALRWLSALFSNCKAENDTVLLSQTLLYSERYDTVLPEITRDARTAAFFCGSLFEVSGMLRGAPLTSARHEKFGVHPMQAGYSILGRHFHSAITKLAQHALTLRIQGLSLADDKQNIAPLLAIMDRSVNNRLPFIKRLLKKEHISLYLTVNQYFISEILTILACRELGIRTKQLAHHPYSISVLFSHKSPYYADEFCVWGSAEVEHINKYSPFFHCFDVNLPRVYATGDLEIAYTAAEALSKTYSMERIVTFMTSMRSWTDPNMMEKEFQWRQQFFAKLKELADQQNIRIRIRYRPNSDNERSIQQREAATLQSLGFIVSPSDPASLTHDILTSAAIITTYCSVAWTACILGRKVYRILPAFYHDVYQFTPSPMTIQDIELDDIPTLAIPTEPTVFRKEDFFDVAKILA